MALVVITIDRSSLPVHTDFEFEEWVKYCIGQVGGISMENPLHDLDMEAVVAEFGHPLSYD